ncbi:MAG: hypothetical protein FJY67_08375 [Calditrichaeota bacterium]|nr:hypothetical protein [Calditrichota bacterium]
MTPRTEWQFTSAIAPGWLVLAGLVALLFAFWSYRRTLPPVGTNVRTILALLRFTSLFGGLWLLARPSVDIERFRLEPPKLAFLIDRSASMGLVQGGIDRTAQVRELLTSDAAARLAGKFGIDYLAFDDTLKRAGETLERLLSALPDGPLTDIGSALGVLVTTSRRDLPAGIVLVSDGASNRGPDPVRIARSSPVPIWTIGIGSPAPDRDAMVVRIEHNPVVYQGSKTSVAIHWRAVGSGGKELTVSLRDREGRSMGRSQVAVKSDFDEGAVEFELTPEAAGRQFWTAEVGTDEGELTTGNNRRSFFIDVLKSRMRVLVMAGPPDHGLGDLVRRLMQDGQCEVISRTRRGEAFYEGAWPADSLVRSVDLVLLHHFPSVGTNREALAKFFAALTAHDVPVGLVDGGRLDPELLAPIADRLPVVAQRTPTRLVQAQVTPLGRHAVIAAPEDERFAARWSALPPLTYAAGRWSARPGSEVLAQFRGADGEKAPALVVFEQAGSRSAALLVRDFWKWGIVPVGSEDEAGPLWGRLVRFLALRKAQKHVVLKFDRDQYPSGEPVTFEVSVYDGNFQPIDGAEVTTEVVSNGKEGGRILLEGIGSGRYRGSFATGSEGEYRVRVAARYENSEVGEDRGSVLVEPYSVELLETRLNEEPLARIAAASGGGYAPAEKADSLLDGLRAEPREIVESSHYDLWGKWWILSLILTALTFEWTIRMRTGML